MLRRYESQHIVILLLLPLALYCPNHNGHKPQSPNLLSLYEPLPCHILHTKKESFSGSLPLFLVCPPKYLAQSKNLPSYMPAHSRSFSYLYCTSCSCKERYILERRSPATQITLSTQWFLEQSQCTVQFYFLTVTERAPDAAWERKYRERNTQSKVSVAL